MNYPGKLRVRCIELLEGRPEWKVDIFAFERWIDIGSVDGDGEVINFFLAFHPERLHPEYEVRRGKAISRSFGVHDPKDFETSVLEDVKALVKKEKEDWNRKFNRNTTPTTPS